MMKIKYMTLTFRWGFYIYMYMNLKRIIQEEINDFDWIKDTEPQLKTYRVTYRSEMWIEAYDMEQAQSIYQGVDLNDVNNSITGPYGNEPGIRSNEWYDTTSFEELDI